MSLFIKWRDPRLFSYLKLNKYEDWGQMFVVLVSGCAGTPGTGSLGRRRAMAGVTLLLHLLSWTQSRGLASVIPCW